MPIHPPWQTARNNERDLWCHRLNRPIIAIAIIEEPRKRQAAFGGSSTKGAALTASVYRAIAIYTDSGTGPWPVSGARYYYEKQIFQHFFLGFSGAVYLLGGGDNPKSVSFSFKRKGASGSWAVALLCLHLRCKWGFAYPPGILKGVLAGEIKENRILRGILYKQLKVYTAICQERLNDGRY